MKRSKSERLKILEESFLYAILDTGYLREHEFLAAAESLLEAGIRIFQLRAKKESLEEIFRVGKSLVSPIQQAGALFVINDYPELVAPLGADGLHVGQEDGDLVTLRTEIPQEALLGLSTHSLEEVQRAAIQKPDYIGFGPLYATQTKPNYFPIGLKEIAEAHKKVSFPLFCIGGIHQKTLPQVLEAGARRVVIVSALLKAPNRREQAEEFLSLITSKRENSLRQKN